MGAQPWASAFPPTEQGSSDSLAGRAPESTEVKLVLTSPKHQTLCADWEPGWAAGPWVPQGSEWSPNSWVSSGVGGDVTRGGEERDRRTWTREEGIGRPRGDTA